MEGKTCKVGLVGVGRGSAYGQIFADHPRCEIGACCDVSEAALVCFQKELQLPDNACFTNYDEFIGTGMDAVFLGTPMPYHADEVVQAVEAGVNVLSEVTAASTLDGCERIVEAVRRTGRTYMLAENCVYWPFVQQWKKMVRAGRIGEIFYAECEYLHPIPSMIVNPGTGEPRWRAGRAPLHYCSHSLGPVLEITGDRIVRAMGLGCDHRLLPEGGVGGIDIQVSLFETERGVMIKLLRSSVVPRSPHIHFYYLQGTGGYVETDRQGPSSAWLYVKREMERAEQIACPLVDESLPEQARQGGHGTAEYCVVREFLRALETGEKPALDVARAMDLSVPGLIAHDSATRGGVWLDVPSFA